MATLAAFRQFAIVVLTILVALVQSARVHHYGHTTDLSVSGKCPPRKPLPPPPTTPLQYNGISWPEYCFEGDAEEHLFILGDWGGLDVKGHVFPAPNANRWRGRYIKRGIDDQAQQLVAKQMEKYAAVKKPRLVLNGGDNFYWGGIKQKCGLDMQQAVRNFADPNADANLQLKHVFEDMYGGALSSVPWLLCFGNHDYGGFSYHSAWDQQIAYTWSNATTRWILPGQFWHQRINYPSKQMTVDVFMIDTCNQDTTNPYADAGHNICSAQHNGYVACPDGPQSPQHCVAWFAALWKNEVAWMEKKLCSSDADWKIIVTHFPPEDNTHQPAVGAWRHIHETCGIDFYVGSHRHDQELHASSGAGFPYVVAGGGGGVTSEKNPGDNTQYGFFDMLLEKNELTITSYNQLGRNTGGMIIHKTQQGQRANVSWIRGDRPR